MKTQFTKGEWFVSGGTAIVSMPSQCKITNHVSGWNDEEAKANGKLIAAAPTLFYTIVILAWETGAVYLFERIYEATGIMYRYSSDDFSELVTTAKNYFNEKA